MARKLIVALLILLPTFSATWAAPDQELKLILAAPFTNNMILQRQVKAPVWGFDEAGSEVTVKFAGQTKSVVADKKGEWRIDLDPLEASAVERTFTVSDNRGRTISLTGVLVGEVWFSSGQSNMVWLAGKSMCQDLARQLSSAKEELPIREINIETVSAVYPQKKATSEGGWKKSREASGFSALSLAFAHELHKELHVPVGILLSAHSNTRIEAFTQRQAIEAHPALKSDAALIHEGDVVTESGRAAFEKYYSDLKAWQKSAIEASEAGGDLPRRPALPGIAGMWRGPSQFFSGKINPVVPYAIRGALWCQGESNADDGRIYAARMEALVRGWRDAWGMPDMPFYFTQLQAYGTPNPDDLGFADIRQAQFLFFLNNRKGTGMVVQTDLNAARPQGIHYNNKLHPGMRLARWALAKQYGKEIAFTGPIYQGYQVEGEKVIVSFEKESLFGGLMVGSKGMEKDYREADKFVEPAKPTPGDKLNHFRLCGADRKWHAADAVIQGDKVVVTSKDVSKPIGVQYAFNAVPENSNLYNAAGLPATPFAAIDGQLIFDVNKKPNTAQAEPAADDAPKVVRPMLQVAEYYRDGAVIQRDAAIPVWGHANPGTKVTVTLGSTVQLATTNPLGQWSVSMPAMKASAQPVALTVETNDGLRRQVENILVGDVWYVTGGSLITSEMAHDARDKNAPVPDALPLVREFKRNTAASSSPTPRKRSFETGGGKYRSHWLPADYSANSQGVTRFSHEFARTLDRKGIPQGFVTMSSADKQTASPLSWTSYAGVKNVTNPAFEARINELMLQYPGSEVARKALDKHIEEVKACVQTIREIASGDGDLSRAPLQFPAFPEPGKRSDVPTDTVPTYTYNWCVSPLTPMAVAGVIWIPSPSSIGQHPAEYAAELEIYAKSLPGTYGQKQVQFIYAQPTEKLVKEIGAPSIQNAICITFDAWPKSLKDLAAQMAKALNEQR